MSNSEILSMLSKLAVHAAKLEAENCRLREECADLTTEHVQLVQDNHSLMKKIQELNGIICVLHQRMQER